MIERQLDIAMKDGASTTFIVHPDRNGPFPVIVFLMDAPGIREELRDMARRFATSGYYVMLPNMYHRRGVVELGPIDADPDHPSRKQMYELMESLSIPMVMDDIDALLAFAAEDPAAKETSVGTVGYCMSGRYAVCAADGRPNVKATASIYGVRLVTEENDSPHLVAKRSSAEFYFACAERDRWAPQDMVDRLKAELADANGEVEQYADTDHGFAFPKRPVYKKLAAEQHWERVLSLFRRNLHGAARRGGASTSESWSSIEAFYRGHDTPFADAMASFAYYVQTHNLQAALIGARSEAELRITRAADPAAAHILMTPADNGDVTVSLVDTANPAGGSTITEPGFRVVERFRQIVTDLNWFADPSVLD